MKLMKKLTYSGNDHFSVESCPIPEPGLNQVLVKIKAASICGSDLHIKAMHDDNFILNPNYQPFVLGHEPSGIVSAVGPGVHGLSAGDRTAVYHKIGCGWCRYCREGNIVFCESGGALSTEYNGAFADYLLVPKENCLPLPEELSYADGAILMCAGGTSYSALKKIDLRAGQSLAIFGCGPIGLASLLFAKSMGAFVFCVDIVEERLKLAQRLGADEIHNAAQDKEEQDVYDLIHGFRVNASSTVRKMYEWTAGKGMDAVLESSASEQARLNGLDCLKKQGKMVYVGLDNRYRKGLPFQRGAEPEKIIFKEIQLFGSNVFPLPMYYEITEYMIAAGLSLEDIITHRFSLEQSEEAFRAAAEVDSGKVLICWD